jgi:hypothetical protein
MALVPLKLLETERLLFVPSFHKTLVAGVATYAIELFEAANSLDAVYVPIGMGYGRKVAVVQTGGNVDRDVFGNVLTAS